MRARIALTLLLLMITGAGCRTEQVPRDTSTQAPPPAEKPVDTVTPPPAIDAQHIASMRRVYRGGPANLGLIRGINEVAVPPGGEVVVGSGDVMVTWEGSLPADAVVKTTGYSYDQAHGFPNLTQAHFAPGGPERWEVWLEGVLDSRIVLVRRHEPVVQIGYRRDDGALVMVEKTDLALAPGPFTLELLFDQPMNPASLQQVVEQTEKESVIPDPTPIEASWVAPDHARLALSAVPLRLDLAVPWFQAATGLLAAPRGLVVRTTAGAPYLERIHVVTGAREQLMAMPFEIERANLSPDGRFIALEARQKSDDNHGWWPYYVTVADLTAQRLLPVPEGAGLIGWRGNTSLVVRKGLDDWLIWNSTNDPAVQKQGKGAAFASMISPDGRYLATPQRDVQEQTDATGTVSLPLNLAITDLESGATRIVEHLIHTRVIGKDGVDLSQWIAWSPDGNQIAALNPIEWSKSNLVVYDLRSGQSRVVREGMEIAVWGRRLAWSPDGTYLFVTGSDYGPDGYLLPLSGGEPTRLASVLRTTSFWDGTGSRLLLADAPWKGVYVLWPGSGRTLDLGDGLSAGWNGDWAYIIRWPESASRYQASGI